MTTHTTHTGRWAVDEYTRAIKSGRKIVRVPRAIIVEEDGTEDGILIADDLKPETARYVCELHNKTLAA